MDPASLPPPRPGHGYVWYFPFEHTTEYCVFIEPLDDLIVEIRKMVPYKKKYTIKCKEAKLIKSIERLRAKLLKHYEIEDNREMKMKMLTP